MKVNATPEEILDTRQTIRILLEQLDQIILGKSSEIRLAVACLLARGHLLIEDLPGMGKTTLAHGLAAILGLELKRIQFTSDLLPADIIGVSIFSKEAQQFQFHPGPVFSELVLADEINRATPKTQSALLEAMEERQITADGETFRLPDPFFVIATQNPTQLVGTFPLPESQLDRFLMRISLGYPDREAERRLLQISDRNELIGKIHNGLGVAQLLQLQARVREVHSSEALLDYVQDLLAATRSSPWFETGLSPRAGLGLLNSARAWALLSERDHVLPEDIQTVAPAVMGHRLQPGHEHASEPAEHLLRQLLESVPVP